MRTSLAIVLFVSACSSSGLDVPAASEPTKSDAATETSATSAPTALACGVLPPTFACTAFAASDIPPTSAACTTEGVSAFVAACYASGWSSAGCAEWRAGGAKSTTACGTCLQGWTLKQRPNSVACWYALIGGSDPAKQKRCRDATKCYDACLFTKCSAERCDTNTRDESGKNEFERCAFAELTAGPDSTCTKLDVSAGDLGPILAECRDAESTS